MNRPLTITICFFLVLVIGVFLIWPKYQDLRLLQIKVEKMAEKLRATEEYLSDLNKIAEDLKEYQEELSQIDSALPQEFSLPDLLNHLQELSSQSGLILINFSFLGTTPFEKNPRLKEHSLSLTLSGFYSAFKNFLLALEKSGRLIEIKSLSFSGGEKEPFTFTLLIKVFSY